FFGTRPPPRSAKPPLKFRVVIEEDPRSRPAPACQSPCADPWVLARSSRAIERSLQFTPGEGCEACHIGENKFGRSARARPKPQKRSRDEPLRDYTAAAADPRSIPGARLYS